MTTTMDAATASASGAVGTNAQAIIQQVLDDYGLGSLTDWAWGQVTDGATAQQISINMAQTPQFKQRFPGIAARQAAGLPAISPADYVNYEDQAKQLENQYGLPSGFLSNSDTIGNFIGKDVSVTELQDRVQNGYAAVQYAPPEVRQSFTQMFGANGDGALAAHFLDPNTATKLLTQQATAAQISGQAAMGSIGIGTDTAMTLAQIGQTGGSVANNLADLQKNSALYNATATEQNNLSAGKEGVEAEFGLNAQSTQSVIQREQERQAQFQGGGSAYVDQYGAGGIGAAKPQ